MADPTWIDLETTLAIHDEQLAEHGGTAGVRDRGLVDSALARPRNRYACGERSLPRLAASYAYGISRNHPFLDGNKRTSLVVAELFLALNGLELRATDAECVNGFLQLAAGELAEDALAEWLTGHVRKDGSPPAAAAPAPATARGPATTAAGTRAGRGGRR